VTFNEQTTYVLDMLRFNIHLFDSTTETVMASGVMLSVKSLQVFSQLPSISRLQHVTNSARCLCTHQRLCSTASSEWQDENEEDLDEVDMLRDVSGLPKRLKNLMNHSRSPHMIPPRYWDSKCRIAKRQHRNRQRVLFSMHGKSSGVDPAILWPSKRELAEIVEDEKEWEPTLQERWEIMRAKLEEEEAERRQRYVLPIYCCTHIFNQHVVQVDLHTIQVQRINFRKYITTLK